MATPKKTTQKSPTKKATKKVDTKVAAPVTKVKKTNKKLVTAKISSVSVIANDAAPEPISQNIIPKTNLWKWALAILIIAAIGISVNHYRHWHPKVGGVEPPSAVESVKPTTFNAIIGVDSKKYRISLSRADGQIELRTGGSLSWRYNNPGNITYGAYAKSKGAIGEDPSNHLAVFPTYDVGRKAAYDLLFVDESGLKTKNIGEAMKIYAPTKDGFDPNTYTKRLTNELKIKNDVQLKDLSEVQRQKALDILATTDVFISGKITIFKDEADWKARGW